MKLKIEKIDTKANERGTVLQRIRALVLIPNGKRIWKDAWLPLDRDAEPYALGVYQLSDRSFWIDQVGSIRFYGRLDFLADLEDDSVVF